MNLKKVVNMKKKSQIKKQRLMNLKNVREFAKYS